MGTDGRVEPDARHGDRNAVTWVQREDLRGHDAIGEEAEWHCGDAADADRGLPEPDRRRPAIHLDVSGDAEADSQRRPRGYPEPHGQVGHQAWLRSMSSFGWGCR